MSHAPEPQSAPSPRPSLALALRQATGLNPARCYQCGKCSAGCPMAEEMPLRTHQMVRLMQLDRIERLLEDASPWLCLGCETCSSRCPNGVDPARLVDGVRELGHARGAAGPRRIAAFHGAFLDQIHHHGRVFEFGLIAHYKLRTGALFDDVGSVPAMVKRGKLAFTPRTISRDGRAELDRIFAAFAGKEKDKEQRS